ncbi:hypothetical protein LK996_01775 [Lysobacter sp. A6]|uniref:Uncharacterized protein n=1 Tax=Noviluteimonas lactosilytica TaxID=2888523 RepID=A0ABS8JDX9_9GAMM|nr:hypothetical protein [Lysobacter lactosilyticus]MCC8361812.1 hypothetical protein [Lysobacter lactosilyticus]
MHSPRHFDLLHDALFGFARAMLDRFGAFHPFGGYVVDPGQVVQVGFDRAMREEAEDAGRLDALAAALGELDDDAIAHALAIDVHLYPPRDGMTAAIRLHIAHVDGSRIDLVMPYRTRTGLPTEFGPPFVAKGPPIAFREER